jgi:nanoRNase/pAp phosphatase (c-di-AMP/oligoRNAs hydrolase)
MNTASSKAKDVEESSQEKTSKKKPASGKRATYFTKFKSFFSEATGFENRNNSESCNKAAIFTHRCPDPDAIGSMMGMQWLLEKSYGIESDLFYSGEVSHPQNVAMVNLLDPNLRRVDEYAQIHKESPYSIHILCDTVPVNAGLCDEVTFDIVVDHHRENPSASFQGLWINLKAGSCSATVYDLIEKTGLKFDPDNDIDSKLATALMVGISTDTENLMADDATEYEFKAWSGLFEYRHPSALKSIVNFERPKFWVDSKAEATKKAYINEGVAVVGMGIIPSRHRDMIADMSDDMVTWEGVTTAISFAMVDGDRIEGSVRSSSSTVSVPKLCKDLGEAKKGNGGGKLGKGAYLYGMGGGGIDEDDDEATKVKTWDLYNEKERNRILRQMKK